MVAVPRFAALLSVLLLTSCASAPVQQCIQIAGTFNAAGICSRTAKRAKVVVSDTAVFEDIKSVTIEQSGCSLTLNVTGDTGQAQAATLSSDLEWTDNGVAFSWTPRKTTTNLLPGASRDQRTISLKFSDDREVLTLTSAFDEQGLALLFVPFHEHMEAACVLIRAPSSAAAPSR